MTTSYEGLTSLPLPHRDLLSGHAVFLPAKRPKAEDAFKEPGAT
jgi:hypothetical protein